MAANVTDKYKSKQLLKALRDAGYQFTVTDRCEKRYNPKWCHTNACKNMLINALDRQETTDFDQVCLEIVNKAAEGGRKAGWSGKFTFIAQIIRQDEFDFQEKYKKWWYYEYDLNQKYFFIFMKVDHDRQADKKLAGPIVDELNSMNNLGFGISVLNHDKDDSPEK